MNTEFFGTPALFRKIAVCLGLYAITAVYLLFALVEYYRLNEDWVFRPEVIGAVVAADVVFGLFSYYSMLQMDGRFLTAKDMEKSKAKWIIPYP